MKNSKLTAFAILAIIIVGLIPVYLLNKFFQRKLRPRESIRNLFLYLLLMFVLIFVYTFLLVYTIKKIFPHA